MDSLNEGELMEAASTLGATHVEQLATLHNALLTETEAELTRSTHIETQRHANHVVDAFVWPEDACNSMINETIFDLHDSYVKIRDEDDLSCAICRDAYRGNDEMAVLPCKHRFHMKCIDTWFISNLDCPCCRMKFGWQTLELTEVESRAWTGNRPVMNGNGSNVQL
ncbi:uncharacterized protein HMPREF1541_02857 [Cyphellophora europaea CBS 101466]|uniref:RING-type domain-containing protein n=1 Tax=Cyphellophora europaea (strain CBS 101466) TaxID=1220924 RepID=W2S6N2_CYPE1|nr:uncharacterized protein HMPREF1541_02857 [Cyphellophora europaea CBS 101466]ETN43698.1 hypothetical protein HMPREF1541_02857 [Cyphellophora europaea CBS 101466]